MGIGDGQGWGLLAPRRLPALAGRKPALGGRKLAWRLSATASATLRAC